MRGKDYFFNWVVLVYALYLFFNKGMSYSFLAEGTLLVGVLWTIRERDNVAIPWNKIMKVIAVLLGLNLIWLLRGLSAFPAFEVIRDSFIFNYAYLLLIPFLFADRLEELKQYIFQLYAWFPLVATVSFLLVVWFPVLEVWALFGKIPFFEFKKSDMGVQLLIATVLLLSGQLKLAPRFVMVNFLLIAYLFFIVGTFNRGGMVAFLAGLFLYLYLQRKTEEFQQWKTYFRWVPFLLILALSFYSLTKVEDKIQGRNTGIEQLQKNFTSILGGEVEGSLSDNIVWRLGWWGKIMEYTFAGPYFLQGKGLGINLAIDDGIPADESTDRTPLRSPHNFHMSILARYGVPVFALWITLIVLLFKGFRQWLPRKEAALFLSALLAFLINASFDVALEGPMAAFPFWMMMGLGMASAKP